MTSKSPVRSCQDVDEAVLSYAEIKALCAGNPLIREKMDLDIDVARLLVLQADYKSQRYSLEDSLTVHFPREIKDAQEAIAGFKSDMSRLAEKTVPGEDGFSPMVINGVTHTDKEAAGTALLEACKKTMTSVPTKVGNYRGFDMYLSYSISNSAYELLMKGSMSHYAYLSKDVFGNITRMNNALNEMPSRLASAEANLDNLNKQVENAKAELAAPFQFEQELLEKSARLAELNAELSIDKDGTPDLLDEGGEPDLLDEGGEPDLDDEVEYEYDDEEQCAKSEKPSILSEVRANAATIKQSGRGTALEESL